MSSHLIKPEAFPDTAATTTVDAFRRQYGNAHFLFACHAALPLSLTPELLYCLWTNFPVDAHGQQLHIPWMATANLLLSNLCDEVGAGLYEMEQQVRSVLLGHLENNQYFGPKRIREIAVFLGIYVQPQLKSENLDIQDFARTQNWASTAYLKPEKAAQDLVSVLTRAFQQQSDDLLRISSIVKALEKPLSDYPDLLTYAQGMNKYAWGRAEEAQGEFDKVRQSESLHDLLEKDLPPSRSILQQFEVEQRRINWPKSSQLLASIALGLVVTGGFWITRAQQPPTVAIVDNPSSPSASEAVPEAPTTEPQPDDSESDTEEDIPQSSSVDTEPTPEPDINVPEISTPSGPTSDNSILFFRTERYDVRIYRSEDRTLMNVYDARFDINRLVEGPTQFTIQNGLETYISTGSFSGLQARYEVSIVDEELMRLVIRSGSGEIISDQFSVAVNIARPSASLGNIVQRQMEVSSQILRFNTSTYAVNVFEIDGSKFMNVFNKLTGRTEVNGNATSLAPSLPPYENAVSYVSSAVYNGLPVEYFARIDALGTTRLEILDINQNRISQEYGEGAVTFNIPQEDFSGVISSIEEPDDQFVAAIFGNESTFSTVRRLYPNAYMEQNRYRVFINVGNFVSRDAATSRVYELKSNGFDNARVLPRNVQYQDSQQILLLTLGLLFLISPLMILMLLKMRKRRLGKAS